MLIKIDTKKNAMLPIKIATVKEPVAKVVIVNANKVVIIAPIELIAKEEFDMQQHSNFVPQKSLNTRNSKPKIPNIKVIYINVIIEPTSPEQKTAAIATATSKLTKRLKKQEQRLFFSLHIYIPPFDI